MNTKTINSWSFSSLKQYEKCPHSIYLKRIKRIEGPPADDKSPLIRGVKIHEEAEEFVDGRLPDLPKSLKKFEDEFEDLCGLFLDGIVMLEEEWGYLRDWTPCDYNDFENVWLRIKGDAVIQYDKETFTIIDYKTGKSWGNEVSHTQQGQLYAIGLLHRFPSAESITVEFWYLDEGRTTRKHYTRAKLDRVKAAFDKRANAMTTTIDFPPKPNAMNCKWCDYGVFKGNGKCAFAVDPELK
jgi:RecB family exonuclease